MGFEEWCPHHLDKLEVKSSKPAESFKPTSAADVVVVLTFIIIFWGGGIFIILLPRHRILISLSNQSWWSLVTILSMHHLRNVLSWTGGGLNLSEARQSKWQGHLHARAAVNMKVSVTCCWNWLLQQVLWTFYDCWCESNCCHLILFLDTHCQSYTSLLPTCFLLDL